MPVTLQVNELLDQRDLALGTSDWTEVTQEQIDTFADATHDHQWIHVDEERAADGPFGTTIAHGYLVLSLVPSFVNQVLDVPDKRMGVNYGLGRLRFTAPVPVESRLRGDVTLVGAEAKGDGVLYTLSVSVEIEGEERPALVAEVMYLVYP